MLSELIQKEYPFVQIKWDKLRNTTIEELVRLREKCLLDYLRNDAAKRF
jgi:hypothetical protein